MDRRDMLTGLASVAVAPLAAAQASRPVVLGQVSLSFYAVTGEVVTAVLERLGHVVEQVHGVHEDMFPRLHQASIDLMAAAWLPEGHAAYWQQYGTAALEVATLYEGARFFWAVPDYIPQTEIASMQDLARPQVALKMTREMQGIGEGATISVLSRKALQDYGLIAAGYRFRPGTQAEWLAATRAAIDQRRWIVVPMWTPSFLNQGMGLRSLQDPRSVLGGPNRAVLAGPNSRFIALPERTRSTLARIRFDLDAVTQMDWQVNEGGATPRAAARAWMDANAQNVNEWFSSVA